MAKPGINEFYDVNKFPKEPGITYFGISIPLLNNTQSPEKCYEMDMHTLTKIQVSNVGAQVVYTDNLYLYSPESAMDLKLKHQKIIEEHKRGWLNLIRKNISLIPSAFTFMTWNQLILDCENFSTHLVQFRKIHDGDTRLQQLVQLDIKGTGREVNQYTIGYMLEEILLDYLIMKGKVRLQNEYTKDKEVWILNCYPGKPHRSHIYLHQQNFFAFENPKNEYENSWYDLMNKKLYHFERLDIDTFDFSKIVPV